MDWSSEAIAAVLFGRGRSNGLRTSHVAAAAPSAAKPQHPVLEATHLDGDGTIE
jgi:hypothetical protein